VLKNYDIRFPLLFAAACLFEVVGAAFGVWNSFMVVGYRMSGLMPAFLSLMEVARPFVIGPLLTDRFRLLHRGCALLALCLLSVVGYKNWSIQANIWFNDMVEKAATAQETVASAEDSLRTAEKGLAEQVEQVTRQAALDATKRVALEASIAGSEQAAKDLRGRLGELDRAYKEQRESSTAACMKVSTPGCVASQLKLLGERYAADTKSLHAQLQQLEVSKAAGGEQLRKIETVHALDGERAAGSVVADARRALDESKREFAKQLDGNLVYAIAGTLNNVKPRELTSEQMSTFRFWVVNLVTFAAVLGASVLNAIAVWPHERSIFRRLFGGASPAAHSKVSRMVRAWLARRRRPVYRTVVERHEVPTDTVVTKVEQVPTEVPVVVDRWHKGGDVEVHHHIEYVPVGAGGSVPERVKRVFRLTGKPAADFRAGEGFRPAAYPSAVAAE